MTDNAPIPQEPTETPVEDVVNAEVTQSTPETTPPPVASEGITEAPVHVSSPANEETPPQNVAETVEMPVEQPEAPTPAEVSTAQMDPEKLAEGAQGSAAQEPAVAAQPEPEAAPDDRSTELVIDLVKARTFGMTEYQLAIDQALVQDQEIAAELAKLRTEAKELYPDDPKAQAAHIKGPPNPILDLPPLAGGSESGWEGMNDTFVWAGPKFGHIRVKGGKLQKPGQGDQIDAWATHPSGATGMYAVQLHAQDYNRSTMANIAGSLLDWLKQNSFDPDTPPQMLSQPIVTWNTQEIPALFVKPDGTWRDATAEQEFGIWQSDPAAGIEFAERRRTDYLKSIRSHIESQGMLTSLLASDTLDWRAKKMIELAMDLSDDPVEKASQFSQSVGLGAAALGIEFLWNFPLDVLGGLANPFSERTPAQDLMVNTEEIIGRPGTPYQQGGQVAGIVGGIMIGAVGAPSMMGMATSGWRGIRNSAIVGGFIDFGYSNPDVGNISSMLIDMGYEEGMPGYEIVSFLDASQYKNGAWDERMKGRFLGLLEGAPIGLFADLGFRMLGASPEIAERIAASGRQIVDIPKMRKAFAVVVERNGHALRMKAEGMTSVQIEVELGKMGLGLSQFRDEHLVPALADILYKASLETANPMTKHQAKKIVTDGMRAGADPRKIWIDPTMLDVSPNISAHGNRVLLSANNSDDAARKGRIVNRNYQEVTARMPEESRVNRTGYPASQPGQTRPTIEGKKYHEMDLKAKNSDSELTQEDVDAVREFARTRNAEEDIVDPELAKMEGSIPIWDKDFLNRALKQTNEARYWYELAAEEISVRFPWLKGEELDMFLHNLALDSTKTAVDTNLYRSMSRMSDRLGNRPSKVDAVLADGSYAPLFKEGHKSYLDTNLKTPSFGGTVSYLMGNTDVPPITVQDALMCSSLQMPKNASTSNTVVYEYMHNMCEAIATRLNRGVAQGEELWQPHQVQAAIWTQWRIENPGTSATLSDGETIALGFHDTLADVIDNRLGSMLDLPRNEQGMYYMTREAWADPRVVAELRPNLQGRMEAPVIALEAQTKLDPAVEGAVDITGRFQAMMEHYQAGKPIHSTGWRADDLKLVQDTHTAWNNILLGLQAKNVKPSPSGKETSKEIVTELAQAIRGRGSVGYTEPVQASTKIGGVEMGQYSGGQWFGPMGTYKGQMGINMRIPATRMTDQEVQELVGVLSFELRQQELYASRISQLADQADAAEGNLVVPEVFYSGGHLTSQEVEQLSRLLGADVSYQPSSVGSTLQIFTEEGFETATLFPKLTEFFESESVNLQVYPAEMRSVYSGLDIPWDKSANADTVIKNMETRMLTAETAADWPATQRDLKKAAGEVKRHLEWKDLGKKTVMPEWSFDANGRFTQRGVDEYLRESDKATLKALGLESEDIVGMHVLDVRGYVEGQGIQFNADDIRLWESVLDTPGLRQEFLTSEDPVSIIARRLDEHRERFINRAKSLPDEELTNGKAKWKDVYSDDELAIIRKYIGIKTSGAIGRGEMAEALGRGELAYPTPDAVKRLVDGSAYRRQGHYRAQLGEIRDANYARVADNAERMKQLVDAENELQRINEPPATRTLFNDGIGGDQARAAVEYDDSGYVYMRLSEAATLEDINHEMGHIVQIHAMTGANRGRTGLSLDSIRRIENHYGIKSGQWDANVEAQEQFARDFEAWVTDETGTVGPPAGVELDDFRMAAAELRDVTGDLINAGLITTEAGKAAYRSLRNKPGLPIRYAPNKYMPAIDWTDTLAKAKEWDDAGMNWWDQLTPEDLAGTSRMTREEPSEGQMINRLFELNSDEDMKKLAAAHMDLARAAKDAGLLDGVKSDDQLRIASLKRLNDLLGRGSHELDRTLDEWLYHGTVDPKTGARTAAAFAEDPDEAILAVQMMMMNQLKRTREAADLYAASGRVEDAAVLQKRFMEYQIIVKHAEGMRQRSGRGLRAWGQPFRLPTEADLRRAESAESWLKEMGHVNPVGDDLLRIVRGMKLPEDVRGMADTVLRGAKGMPWAQRMNGVYQEHFINSLLSAVSTWSPLGITGIGPLTVMAIEGLERQIGGLYLGLTGRGFDTFIEGLKNIGRLKTNSRAALRYTLKALATEEPQLMGNRASLVDPGWNQKAISLGGDNWVAAGVNLYGQGVRAPSRAIMTTDEFFRQINSRTQMEERLWTRAMNEEIEEAKKLGQLPKLPTRRELRNYKKKHKQRVLEEVRAGMDRVYSDGMIRNQGVLWKEAYQQPHVQALADKPAQQAIEAARYVDDHWTPQQAEDVAFAERAAVRAVFQEDLGEIGNSIAEVLNNVPLLKVIIPFHRTPSNIVKRFAGYSPTSPLVEQSARLETAIRTRPFQGSWSLDPDSAMAKFHSETMEDLASGDQVRVARARGRQAMGAAMMLWALDFATRDEGVRMSGKGPDDPAMRRQMQDNGWQPYSLFFPDGTYGPNGEENGTWVSYAKTAPYSMIFGSVADMAEVMAVAESEGDPEDMSMYMFAAAQAFANQVKNASFLRGLGDSLQMLDADPEQGQKLFTRMAASATTYGAPLPPFMQSLVRNAKYITDDQIIRDFRSMTDQYRAMTPLGDIDNVDPQWTYYGEMRRRVTPNSGAGVQWFKFLSPVQVNKVTNDPAYLILDNLGHGFEPPNPKREGINLYSYRNDEYKWTANSYFNEQIGMVRRLQEWPDGSYEMLTFKETVEELVYGKGKSLWDEMGDREQIPGQMLNLKQIREIQRIHAAYEADAWMNTIEFYPEIKSDLLAIAAAKERASAKEAERDGAYGAAEAHREEADKMEYQSEELRDILNQLEANP